MNIRLLSVIGAAIALAYSASAKAEGPWYVSGSVGGYFRETDTISTSFFHSNDPGLKVPGSNRLSFNPDVIGNIAFGYEAMPQIRVEAEIGYTDYSGNSSNPLAHSSGFPRLNGSTYSRLYGDDYSRFMGTVNAFYDFPAMAGFTPYVGGGLGASGNQKSFGQFVGPFGTRLNSRGGSGTEGLALIEGGVSYPLSDDLALTASYRYIHFFDDGEDIAHIVKMGVRYSF